MIRVKVMLLVMSILVPGVISAEVCTPQSQMTATVRDGLAAAARGLALQVQNNDVSGLQAATAAEYAKDFGGIGDVVGGLVPKLKGGTITVEQVYLLDATQLKHGAGGAAPEAQFFCTLNHTVAEADFTIPGLDAGMYGFVMVDVKGTASPWRLSFLLRQDGGKWNMVGFYPKPMWAAGHDGVWYWRQARAMATQDEHWNAWLYYQQAEKLLLPANFIQSTHLEKLRAEETAVAPPAVSDGVSATAPLVVKGADGVEYRFTSMGVDDSLGKEKTDVIVHMKVDAIGDAATADKRNAAAMSALVGAYPEMRKAFHGVWVFADAAGQNPYASEKAMDEIH